MTKVKVTNPTNKAKAVRIAGGHAILKPGKSEGLEVNFTDEERARYVEAGLVFKVAKGEDKDALVESSGKSMPVPSKSAKDDK